MFSSEEKQAFAEGLPPEAIRNLRRQLTSFLIRSDAPGDSPGFIMVGNGNYTLEITCDEYFAALSGSP